MIPNLDIWRAANLLIERHGVEAKLVAACRAELMLERGDREDQLMWLRIRRAIVELETVPAGKPLNAWALKRFSVSDLGG